MPIKIRVIVIRLTAVKPVTKLKVIAVSNITILQSCLSYAYLRGAGEY